MQQYFQAKNAHPGVLVAMRVGDFYEFYGEDAEQAAAILEITLTGRVDGKNGKIAMAGVPYHSIEKYLARLVQAGEKVALCDQVEDPKKTKKLVRREVTRVLSKGTVLEDSMLSSGENSFLAAICVVDGHAGLATLDPTTGEFMVTEFDGEQLEEQLLQELARLKPAELVHAEAGQRVGDLAKSGLGVALTEADQERPDRAEGKLLKHFGVASLKGFGCEDKPTAVTAAAMILGYAESSGLSMDHVESLMAYSVDGFMNLDPSTRRSLELTQSMTDGSRRFTLISVLDETRTAMGARMLRRLIEQPILDIGEIENRNGAVARLIEHALTRGDLRDALKMIADIERLVSRASTGLASPKDLAALRNTLLSLPELDDPLRKVALEHLEALREEMADHSELARTLDKALVDEPPLTIREGGIFKEGYDPELDKLRVLARSGRDYIAKLEAQERETTGIDKLKVGFNSVFGYYIEVSKIHLAKVPEHYIRKQTTASAERYITAELKDHESAVLGADEKAQALESDLFARLRNKVTAESGLLLKTARAIAELDVLAGLAEAAVLRDYVKPDLTEENTLEIIGGRHPVVEANDAGFVPNDIAMDDERLMILTGPNMSGKSTYLRQVALIVLMAQIGSFVPAKTAKIGLCDRIFTRIGAKDEIALGQSTFMVEMIESANILNSCTDRSLVILDEVGRGTSTFDGLAIAWAMVEFLAGVGPKTLFATHYHQLNNIAEQIGSVYNCRVSVEEVGDQVIWTHKVLPGGTDRSYGVQVARMAGLPHSVLARAEEVLSSLEENDLAPAAVGPGLQNVQFSLFAADDPAMVKELRKLNVEQMTPLEALAKLDEWKRSLKPDEPPKVN